MIFKFWIIPWTVKHLSISNKLHKDTEPFHKVAPGTMVFVFLENWQSYTNGCKHTTGSSKMWQTTRTFAFKLLQVLCRFQELDKWKFNVDIWGRVLGVLFGQKIWGQNLCYFWAHDDVLKCLSTSVQPPPPRPKEGDIVWLPLLLASW